MATSRRYEYPVCRIAMIGSMSIITLLGVCTGLDPYVVFQRMLIGTLAVGVVSFIVSRLFAAMFT